jgi:hypothetical protein
VAAVVKRITADDAVRRSTSRSAANRTTAANEPTRHTTHQGEPMSTTIQASAATSAPLSIARLYAMRGGYLFMVVGLALVKWPLLPSAHTLPVYEGVTLSLLTGMSLLALLGLRYPVKMLPVLLFEVAWKLLWLGLVALPNAVAGDLDAERTRILANCSLVVVIVAVTPWGYVWRSLGGGAGDRWR